MPDAAGSDDELAFASATDLVAMLRDRRIGARELLDIHLARYERINPAINAIVALDLDRAAAAAVAADARPADHPAGALAGLPMTVKETFGMTGMRTSVGLPDLAEHRPDDAVAVGRLRDAGAVIFGKTNIPIAGADHQTANPIYGLTRNPWALDRTVGGSSGGAAAALAAGLTPLELGSDIGGSIRIPAHMCGVFGHKASYGHVPTLGHVPPFPGVEGEAELSVAGPLARFAADLELGMDVLTGANGRSPASRHETLRGFRIALWAQDLPYDASAETVAAIHRLGDGLHAAGATVSRTARPDIDFAASLETYLRTLFGIVLEGHPFALSEDERRTLPADALLYGSMLERASQANAQDMAALREARAALQARWADFFRNWDVMVCPVFPTTAFEHDLSGEGLGAQLHRRRQVDDRNVVYMSQLSWPSLATIAHLPATTIPVPRAPGELPLGLQLIGPHLEDRTTLRLAALIERELGYAAARPPLDAIAAGTN